MHLIASIRPSVCVLFVCAQILGKKGGHCRSRDFVCVSIIRGSYADNLADAVDRLLFPTNPLISLSVFPEGAMEYLRCTCTRLASLEISKFHRCT